MTEAFQKAYRLLHRNEIVARQIAVVESNRRLLRAIRRAAPPPLDKHCLHASLESGILTVLTDSPVWSSRLRFFAPELASALAPRFGRIATWNFRVRPCGSTPSESLGANRKHKISSATAHLLRNAAAGIQDADLADALRRLASLEAQES